MQIPATVRDAGSSPEEDVHVMWEEDAHGCLCAPRAWTVGGRWENPAALQSP